MLLHTKGRVQKNYSTTLFPSLIAAFLSSYLSMIGRKVNWFMYLRFWKTTNHQIFKPPTLCTYTLHNLHNTEQTLTYPLTHASKTI